MFFLISYIRFGVHLLHPVQPLLKAKQLFCLDNLLRKGGNSGTQIITSIANLIIFGLVTRLIVLRWYIIMLVKLFGVPILFCTKSTNLPDEFNIISVELSDLPICQPKKQSENWCSLHGCSDARKWGFLWLEEHF